MPHLSIVVDDPAAPGSRRLLNQLDALLLSLYPVESTHLLTVKELRQPHVLFLTARIDEQAVGCGAVVNHGGEYAEIKRMFVLPEQRGQGIAGGILRELEQYARRQGLQILRLETGIHQVEAMKLYAQFGYQRRPPFGEYADDPLSICLEKTLE
jgi:putative acetyltransferase